MMARQATVLIHKRRHCRLYVLMHISQKRRPQIKCTSALLAQANSAQLPGGFRGNPPAVT